MASRGRKYGEGCGIPDFSGVEDPAAREVINAMGNNILYLLDVVNSLQRRIEDLEVKKVDAPEVTTIEQKPVDYTKDMGMVEVVTDVHIEDNEGGGKDLVVYKMNIEAFLLARSTEPELDEDSPEEIYTATDCDS